MIEVWSRSRDQQAKVGRRNWHGTGADEVQSEKRWPQSRVGIGEQGAMKLRPDYIRL